MAERNSAYRNINVFIKHLFVAGAVNDIIHQIQRNKEINMVSKANRGGEYVMCNETFKDVFESVNCICSCGAGAITIILKGLSAMSLSLTHKHPI